MKELTALQALRELREAISSFKGHGTPGFKDRAQALLVLWQADQILAKEFPDYVRPE